MQYDIIDDTDYVDLRGVDFHSDIERRKCFAMKTNDENISEIFFEHLFPRAKGYATFIDEFHYFQRLPYCSSVKHEKIVLYPPEYVDPNHLVQAC